MVSISLEQQSQQWKYLSTSQTLNVKRIQTEVQDGVGIITFADPSSPVSFVACNLTFLGL